MHVTWKKVKLQWILLASIDSLEEKFSTTDAITQKEQLEDDHYCIWPR